MKANDTFAGRYLLKKMLGRGNMGTVWICEDTFFDNRVQVIKIFAKEVGSDKETYHRLNEVFAIALNMVHPNLLPARHLDIHHGTLFQIMHFLKNGSLEDRSGNCDKVTSFRYLHQIAKGLKYLHDHEIVHGDLSATNVLLSNDDIQHCYITDFGVNSLILQEAAKTEGAEVYHRECTAPEVLAGESPRAASDIYALGVIHCKLVGIRLPWGAGQLSTQHDRAVLFSLLRKTHQGNEAGIIMEALSMYPEKRPTAADMMHTLEPFHELSAKEKKVLKDRKKSRNFLTWLVFAFFGGFIALGFGITYISKYFQERGRYEETKKDLTVRTVKVYQERFPSGIFLNRLKNKLKRVNWEYRETSVLPSSGLDIIKFSKDGYIVVSGTLDEDKTESGYLYNVYSDGAYGWKTKIPGVTVSSATIDKERGHVILAGTQNRGETTGEAFVGAISSSGGEWRWKHSYLSNTHIVKVVPLSGDRGYFLVGNSFNEEDGGILPLVILVDKDGKLLWKQSYTGKDSYPMKVLAATVGKNDELLIGGTIAKNEQDIFIMGIASDGKQLWETEAGYENKEILESLAITPDGGIICIARTNSVGKGGWDAMVFKLRPFPDLAIEWEHLFGGNSDDIFFDITPVEEDYVMVGSTRSKGNGESDLWLMKLKGSNGAVIWEKTHGDVKADAAHAAIIDEQTIVIAGNSESNKKGVMQSWVLRLDKNGDSWKSLEQE